MADKETLISSKKVRHNLSSSTYGYSMRHGSRAPPFLIVGLLVVIAILGYNYWNLESTNAVLQADLNDVQYKFRDCVLKKGAAEKYNEALKRRVQEKETELDIERSRVARQEKDLASLQSELHDAKRNREQCEENKKTEILSMQAQVVSSNHVCVEIKKLSIFNIFKLSIFVL